MFLEESGGLDHRSKINIISILYQDLGKKEEMFDSLRDRGLPLKLGGDARFCSQGRTAKYGSYSFISLETSKVLDVQLVQVRYRSICLFYNINLFNGISHQ